MSCQATFDIFKIFCFFFYFFAEDILKSLLRGPKPIRKKYQVVFEKFANQCLKKWKKTQPPILATIFELSNFFEIFWAFRKKYLETHSKSIRNRFEKIVSSLRDISLKKKASRPSHPIPSVRHVKKFREPKKASPRRCFWNEKKKLLGRYKSERDQSGNPWWPQVGHLRVIKLKAISI